MKTSASEKPGFIQHKVSPEIKAWIEREARAQERSQAWFVQKLVADAFQRAQHKGGAQ